MLTKTLSELEDLIDRRSTSLENATAAQTKTALRETAQLAIDNQQALGIVSDPGSNPTAPAGLVVSPITHGFSASWNQNPQTDYVTSYVVQVTPGGSGGGAATTYQAPKPFFSLATFAASSVVSVAVAAVNQWGRQGPYSPAVTITTGLSVAEQINLDQVAQQGRLQGLLPNVNLAPIGDSSKFAAGVVQNVHLAAGQNANVLPFNEAEYENWADNTGWPPPGVSASISAGAGASVQSVNGRKWLFMSVPSGTALPALFALRSDWTQRGASPGLSYIYSAYVRNQGSAPMSLYVYAQNASDASGTGAATFVTGTSQTIPNDGNEYRVWIPLTVDSAKPYMRFAFALQNAGTLYVSRHQLEAVSATQREPGKYSVPASSFGAMSGYFLATMDAAVVNAVIGTAAISSAKIASLAADKIIAGTIASQVITLGAGGVLQAGPNVQINSGGIDMAYVAGSWSGNGSAAVAPYAVSSPDGHVALFFYTDSVNTMFGANLRADGYGGYNTSLAMIATMAGAIGQATTAYVRATAQPSGAGIVEIANALQVYGNQSISGNATVGGTLGVGAAFNAASISASGSISGRAYPPQLTGGAVSIAAGGTASWSHGFGTLPNNWSAWWLASAGVYAPVPSADSLITQSQYDTSALWITNKKSVAYTCGCYIYR